MNLLTRLFALCLVLSILIACTSPKPLEIPDADTISLVALSEQARRIAQKEIPDAVLRQVDTGLGKTTFRFTDKVGTKEIDITAPSPNTPPDQWTAYVTSLSPLLGRSEPDMNIKDVRAGPSRVAQAVTAHWSGCQIRALTLYRDESENDLIWVDFCDTPQGTVSGEMVNRTGVFQPFNAPPAVVPVTATAVP